MPESWLLLLPQLPPHPSGLRVRVWRRLQQIGAVAVKNAAYALPESDATLEDFQWLQQEIVDAGGGALLLHASGCEEADEEIRRLFRTERDGDYRRVVDEAAALADQLRGEKEWSPGVATAAERAVRQLRERMERLKAIDFFAADGGPAAVAAVGAVAAVLSGRMMLDQSARGGTHDGPFAGRVWVTRAGVYVDRLACAWMIRRFIDPEARFAFVPPGESPPPDAVPFDMPGVEFGHHGPCCSIETLAARFRPEDPALRAVAEVVHDLDLKDEGFGRPEAAGLKRLLDGLCAAMPGDKERVRAAAPIFDALYTGFGE